MTTSTDTLQQLAAEAYGWFETARRDPSDIETSYVRTKDGSPDWVTDLVHHAHGDFLPDDWRYAQIRDALGLIADADESEDARFDFADSAVDVYTARGLAWLASNLNRQGYCDEWLAEHGGNDLTISAIVAGGQYLEADEIYGLILSFLEQRAEEVSDNSD